MNTTTQARDISALIAHIVSECKPVDREARFDEMLNECYSFEKVGGPFESMQPSSVLKECDPTAYRCGVNDYAHGEDWTEVQGETYADEGIETARAEFVDGLNDELSALQDELEELNEDSDDEPESKVGTFEEIEAKQAEIDALEAFIAECERHSF